MYQDSTSGKLFFPSIPNLILAENRLLIGFQADTTSTQSPQTHNSQQYQTQILHDANVNNKSNLSL